MVPMIVWVWIVVPIAMPTSGLGGVGRHVEYQALPPWRDDDDIGVSGEGGSLLAATTGRQCQRCSRDEHRRTTGTASRPDRRDRLGLGQAEHHCRRCTIEKSPVPELTDPGE
jgi:hypothetical protein